MGLKGGTFRYSGGVDSPAIRGTGPRALAVWCASCFAMLACQVLSWSAVALLGLPPRRAGTCRSVSVESVSPEDSTGEATSVAWGPPSALGGVPSASLRTSSAELSCSSAFEAQLPAASLGAFRTGAVGFISPLEVSTVEGVAVLGVNPVTLILSESGVSDFPEAFKAVGSRSSCCKRSAQRRPDPQGTKERYG